MLSRSDLPAFGRTFLVLQKSQWSALNGYGKLTSRAFQQYIIVHTFLRIRRPKTGVQCQPSDQFWRPVLERDSKLESNAQKGAKTGVNTQGSLSTWISSKLRPNTHKVGPRSEISH
ncbi:uncharacterized protein DS421_19g656160 [Arachis hypogaea]|uniref:Uncharacterized protein n=1 Tax=Arachis hypogaea TaxID=3818 RepID=A0A6B9V8Z2_ARAHY|nr:uncharacterized protein DS421_19g656160 [Arachis hypogaea]